MKTTLVTAALLASVLALACNPVHSDQVDALGGEASNVHEGPTHRPGQPCLVCHDGALGDPPEFSVAGTVFQTAGSTAPVDHARVQLLDVTGSSYTATTNEAGNFYISPNQWTPHYPMTASITGPAGESVAMQTLISRNGACAGCHVDPVGPASPGRVSLMLQDGGTPP